jgi:hypothetical protein
MSDTFTEGDNRNARIIVDAAFRQTQLLESISGAIDYKAGVLMGFLAIVITLAFQVGVPNAASVLDLLFGYAGFALLFTAFATLIASLSPRRRRYGPNVEKLLLKCWDFEERETLEKIVKELNEVWIHNGPIHERKATLFKVGLWLSLSGIMVLAVDIMVIRPFG